LPDSLLQQAVATVNVVMQQFSLLQLLSVRDCWAS